MWIAAILAATVSTAALYPGHRAPAPNGIPGSPLLRAFFGASNYDGRLKLSLSEASKETRSEIERRLARTARVQSRLPKVHTADPIELELAGKRMTLERAAVTMLGRPGVVAEAARYAAGHPVSHEWTGPEGGPLAEARFAHRYATEHPRTALGPFLNVLMLNLYRCAFEAASRNNNMEQQREAADGYRWAWERAMRSPDAVIRAVANDIDAEAFLYIADQGHPRMWKSPGAKPERSRPEHPASDQQREERNALDLVTSAWIANDRSVVS